MPGEAMESLTEIILLHHENDKIGANGKQEEWIKERLMCF